MVNASTSSAHLIAREKAREAIESVHTARDNRTIAWNQIRNANPPTCAAIAAAPPLPAVNFTATGGGIFLNGEQQLRQAGPDGLVNTGRRRGCGLRGAAGSERPLRGRRRRRDDIVLNRLLARDHHLRRQPDLRQIQVTVRYRVGSIGRSYTLTHLHLVVLVTAANGNGDSA